MKKTTNKFVKRPGRYNASIKKAEQQLEHTAAALELIRQETQWVVEREKLLIDFIRCQEEVEQILQLQEQMMADIKGSPDPAAAAAACAGRSVYGQVSVSSWSTSMAARIAVGHIMAVQGMSPQEWCAAGCKSFVEMSTLLELCNRDRQTHMQLTGGACEGDATAQEAAANVSDPAAAAAASAAAAAANGSSGGADANGVLEQAAVAAAAAAAAAAAPAPDNSVSSGDEAAAAAATAAAAAAAASAAAAAAFSPSYQGPDAVLQQLVDASICPVYAAMFHAPQPYYAAAACNLSTAEVEIMPQQHLMQVVSRLQLSSHQVMHLRIANTEFVRLARLTSQEGRSLAEQAAKMSLSEVLDHLDDSQPDTTAAAAAVGGSDDPTPSNSRATIHTTSSNSHRRSPLDNAAQKHAARTAAAVSAAAASERSTQTGATAAAAAADSASVGLVEESDHESPGEALSRRLDRYLRHMHIHTVVTAMCIVNTLTPRQMATLTVASFPYAANVHALAEACMNYNPPQPPAHQHTQTDEQQQQQQQQQQQREVLWSEPWARQVESHMQYRNAQLERQVVEWWRHNGMSEQYLRM